LSNSRFCRLLLLVFAMGMGSISLLSLKDRF
jgi:hypothetical protein